MPARSKRVAKHSVAQRQFRSAMTNGSKLFLDHVDQRQAIARRYRDVVGLLISDMGGIDAITEAELMIVRRAATLTVFCESCESAMANGRKLRVEDYLPAVNALRRLLETIGTKRRAKVVNDNTLEGYVTASSTSPARHRVRTARTIDAKPRRVDAEVAAVAGVSAKG